MLNRGGFTLWFTGLPSSGKSTLGRGVARRLESLGVHVELLDGDAVRKRVSKGLGFSKEDRDENIRRISFMAALVTRCGSVAITCAISPYRGLREEARREIGRFVEVHVRCPVEECIRRDAKGLYKLAMEGKIENFTGISDPYEEPESPEVVVDTDAETPGESIERIVDTLFELGYLSNKNKRA